MTRTRGPHDKPLLALRAYGLSLPGAHTKSPWPGHLDLAVNDKTFAYLSLEGEPLSISCKLPDSSAAALMLPGATPTSYGLGKWGWVSLAFEPKDAIPVDMLREWIEESYRSQAKKSQVRRLDGDAGAAPKKTAKKKATKKKATKKKATKKNAATRKKVAAKGKSGGGRARGK